MWWGSKGTGKAALWEWYPGWDLKMGWRIREIEAGLGEYSGQREGQKALRGHFLILKAVQWDSGIECKEKECGFPSTLKVIPRVRISLSEQWDVTEVFLNHWDFYLVSDSVYYLQPCKLALFPFSRWFNWGPE